MPTATIQYLGQAGFRIRVADMTVLIDPYLTDAVDRSPGFPRGFWRRAYPPPVRPEEMTGVDLVLCTHDHLDHTEPETIRAIASASPACRFAAPRLSIKIIHEAGVAQALTTELKEGVPFHMGPLTVDPLAASHEEYETDAEGYDRFLSYVLHWSGLNLYHAGDTVLTPRLLNALAAHPLHIAFLPANGRNDGRRRLNVVGNMDAIEAMHLAHCLAVGEGLEMVTPVHYDLYAFNGARLPDIVEAWENAPWPKPVLKAFLPGEEIVYSF